jgi:hypothetical protein
MIAAINPARVAAVLLSTTDDISLAWTKAAPSMAGIDSKKLKRAANSLSSPKIIRWIWLHLNGIFPGQWNRPEHTITSEFYWTSPLNRFYG